MRGDYKLSQQRGKYVYPPVDERRNWSFSQLIWISEIVKRNKRRRKISLSSLWSATNFYTPHRVFVTVVATRLPPRCGNYAKLSSHHQHMHAPHTTESWADHHEIKKFIIHKTSFFSSNFFFCVSLPQMFALLFCFAIFSLIPTFRLQTLTLLFMEFLSENSFTDPGVFDGITRTRESLIHRIRTLFYSVTSRVCHWVAHHTTVDGWHEKITELANKRKTHNWTNN